MEKKWKVNRVDQGGCIRTGYEEILFGSQEEVERDYRAYHELEDEEKIDVEEVTD